jgi:predicted nuclease with TOPRIM domain
MTRTTITSVRGMPLPNLKAMGLHKDMKPLAALIDEQDKLRRRAQELGYKRQELQEQIKRLEHERTRQWGAAIRAGEEAPTEEGIERAKKRLEEVRQESGAQKHAGELDRSTR